MGAATTTTSFVSFSGILDKGLGIHIEDWWSCQDHFSGGYGSPFSHRFFSERQECDGRSCPARPIFPSPPISSLILYMV
jgi:hypothetical protein